MSPLEVGEFLALAMRLEGCWPLYQNHSRVRPPTQAMTRQIPSSVQQRLGRDGAGMGDFAAISVGLILEYCHRGYHSYGYAEERKEARGVPTEEARRRSHHLRLRMESGAFYVSVAPFS